MIKGMSKIIKINKDQKGFALPIALMLVFVASFLVAPVVNLLGTNLKTDIVVKEKTKGIYAADAGIQYAVWQFTDGVASETYTPGSPIELPENPVNGYYVTVSVVPVTDTLDYKVTSTARHVSTEKITEIVAYLRSSATPQPGPSPFHYALATLGGDLNMSGSSQISCVPKPPATTCSDGDVWINGNINMGWSNVINGTATLTGTVNCPNPNPKINKIIAGADPIERPLWLDAKTLEFVNSTVITLPSFSQTCTAWSDVATTYNSPLCINGNMTLGQTGTYNFNENVRVTGNLIIQNGVNHVYFNKSVRVDGNVILQGNGDVNFRNTVFLSEDTIAYQSYIPNTIYGNSVNISGYNVNAVLTVGTVPPGGTLNVKLQDSNNGSTWTDVSGGVFPTITKSNDETAYNLTYSGNRSYIRAVAAVSSRTIPFGVAIKKTQATVLDNVLSIGGYLYCGGSRSAKFDGQVAVDGEQTYGGYAVNFDGSKYSGVAWDVQFKRTLRVTGNIRFGSGRAYEFYDVIYATGNVLLDGNAGTMNFQKALVADGSITVQGSSSVGATSYETAPFFISRKIGGTGVSLTGNVPVTAIIYAPDSAAYVSGSSQFFGAMVAKSAQLDGDVRLKYPVILDDREDLDDPDSGELQTFSLISYSIQK